MRSAVGLTAVALFALALSAPLDAAPSAKKKTHGKAAPAASKHRSTARKAAPPPVEFDAGAANDFTQRPVLEKGSAGSAVLRAQVLLDRAHFSPGEIDGHFGESTARAVTAFRASRSLPKEPVVDDAAWAELNHDTADVVVRYGVAVEDVAGPFAVIPEDAMEKAKLDALPYQSPAELLGEKFHASPRLLKELNPSATLAGNGEGILVTNVDRPPLPRAALIVVSASDSSVSALDAEGHVLARYPASVGSEHDPLPVGQWKVLGISRNPVFHYNPDLFWDADAKDRKTTMAAGPNNPVGVVWIDLSKPHYGIHGTPEPSTIGRAQTHGCIRLTNWDAVELAASVGPGTPARLED
jgi:lipoprotein-anchoring transpeptidase ErfK/SrfK